MSANKELYNWLKDNDPFLLEVAKQRYALEQSGLAGFTDFLNNIVETVKNVAPSVVNMQSQKKILDIQLKRAEQNLPPLDTTQYSPVIRVAPEITPQAQAAARNIAVDTMSTGLNKILPFALAGIAAFFFMKKRR